MRIKRVNHVRLVRLVIDIESDVALPALRKLHGLDLLVDDLEHRTSRDEYAEPIGIIASIEARSYGDDFARERKRGRK